MTIAGEIRPIVVVGCQRSGTTLLRTMLGRHPDLLEHPDEPQFLLGVVRRFGRRVENVPEAAEYVSRHRYLPATLSREAVADAFSDDSTLSLGQFTQRYLALWGGSSLRRKRPVIKEPAFIHNLALAREFFPAATIVHIIRDPRGCVASQRARWPHLSIWECASLWRQAVLAGRACSRQEDRDYLEIRYERLVENAAGELEQLCRRLRIPYSAEMLRFRLATTTYDPGRPPQRTEFRAVDKSRCQLWKTRLSPSDVRLIELCCRAEMELCRYHPVRPSTSAALFWPRVVGESLYCRAKGMGRPIKDGLRRLSTRVTPGQALRRE